MANTNSVDWLSSWIKPVNFSGKTKNEIKEIKKRYNWFVDAYVYGLNAETKSDNKGRYQARKRHIYKIVKRYWKKGRANPNIAFFKVVIKPDPTRKGPIGGGPGQVTPTPPPIPR